MLEPIHSTWQKRRSEFNHQWLKNRVLSALDAAGNVVQGEVGGDEARLLCDVVSIDLREWPRRRAEAMRLLESIEDSMSPKVFFAYPPLDNWEAELRVPCEQLVHDVWLHRHSIRKLRDNAIQALNDADVAYRTMLFVLDAPIGSFDRDESRRCFHELTIALRRVATSIEALPSRILLP